MSKQTDEMARYFASHGIKNKQIAKRLGLTDQTVSNMLKGRDSLGKKRCAQLAEAYGFDLNYLITGNGTLLPMQSCSATNSQNVIQSSPDSQIGAIASVQELQMECLKLRAKYAACQAENECLRDEVDWLRQQISKI